MKKALIIFLFLTINGVFSQNPFCGTKTPTSYNTYERAKAVRGYDITNISTMHNPICINIRYHIVRKSDGLGGFNTANLQDVTDFTKSSI